MSSTEKKALEILQENVFSCRKNEHLSMKYLKHWLKHKHHSWISVISKIKKWNKWIGKSTWIGSLPHSLNGTPNYHQDVKTNTSGANKNSWETNKNIPEPENLQSQTRNKKQAFVGNLHNNLNIRLKRVIWLRSNYISERKLKHQYVYKLKNRKK